MCESSCVFPKRIKRTSDYNHKLKGAMAAINVSPHPHMRHLKVKEEQPDGFKLTEYTHKLTAIKSY